MFLVATAYLVNPVENWELHLLHLVGRYGHWSSVVSYEVKTFHLRPVTGRSCWKRNTTKPECWLLVRILMWQWLHLVECGFGLQEGAMWPSAGEMVVVWERGGGGKTRPDWPPRFLFPLTAYDQLVSWKQAQVGQVHFKLGISSQKVTQLNPELPPSYN